MAKDPFTLDRDVGLASAALASARAALREDPASAPPRPLAGLDRVSRRDALAELDELASRRPDEPTYAHALAWVRAIVLARALFVDDARDAVARRTTTHAIREPVVADVTVAGALRALLEEREPAARAAWAGVLETVGGEAQALAALRVRRRAEAARIAEVPSLDAVDLPLAEPATAPELARAVLALTEDLVSPRPRWELSLVEALGRDGQDGWPARIVPRWLAELLPPHALDGLSIRPPPMPSPLGVASFARALSLTGAAFAAADVPRGVPRCVARAPADLLVARRAALFGGLVTDPEVVRRVTGRGRGAAREQASRAVRTLARSLRLDAARTLLRGVDPSGGELFARGAEELSRALRAPLPAGLVGVVPRLDAGCTADGVPGPSERLVGAVVAAADREALRDALDEDWFRSPRAADLLRQEHHAHRAAHRASPDEVARGLAALARALSAAA